MGSKLSNKSAQLKKETALFLTSFRQYELRLNHLPLLLANPCSCSSKYPSDKLLKSFEITEYLSEIMSYIIM